MIAGIVASQAGGGAAATSDDFSSDTITSYTLTGSWSISGGYMNHTATSFGTARRTGISWADGTVSAEIREAGNAGLVARWADNGNYYVAIARDASSLSGSPNTIQLYKRVAFGFTSLGSNTIAFTRDTIHTLALTLSGTSLEVFFDGVSKIATTDSSHAAAGQVGMWGDTLPNQFDSFTWG